MVSEAADVTSVGEHMAKHGIKKAVLLATYFPHRGSGISNYRLLKWLEGDDRFVMFASLDFEHYFFQGLNELEEITEEEQVKGIKIYTSYQRIDLSSVNVADVMNIANSKGLPVMFHTGQSYSSNRKFGRFAITDIVKSSDLEVLSERWPDVNIIMSHLGKPFYDDTISVLQRNPNLYTDISGLIDSRYDHREIPQVVEAVKKVLGECGTSKVMFGTDFPVQTHEDSLYFAEQALKGFSDVEKEDFYHNNAWRLLG